MVKWPFGKVKWPLTRGWKGHFESIKHTNQLNIGWWLNQPLWKICDRPNWIISPRIRGENKKHLKPPPRFFVKCHQSRKHAVVGCGCCGGGGVYVSNLNTKNTFITTKNSPSCSILPATNSSHLQINGWKMKFPFGGHKKILKPPPSWL